ncbi:hypothetical protein ACSQ67_022764 [Phaseolus vulgaris]
MQFVTGYSTPPPKDNDSPDGVQVSPRVRLRDGRYLAYREKGVPKDQAKHIIIIVHGFGSSKDMNFLAPQELIDELGICILQYDRAGYGESEPNPKRSLKSEALDIEELADQLQIGSKFYVIGEKLREQVVFDTLKDDWLVAFGNWEFDPLKLSNPFSQNTSSAHIWQGYEDKVVPSQIQRFVTEKLPWIQYHEVPDGGHLIVHYSGVCEAILKALLLGEQNLSYKPRSGVFVS